MPETLVLDTHAFNERGLGHFLLRYHGKKVLPVVAASEIYHHVRVQRRWDAERFRAYLRDHGITVEPLDLGLAMVAVEAQGPMFPENLSDALIGAHALSPGRILVTNNLRHHPDVPMKLTPSELLRGR